MTIPVPDPNVDADCWPVDLECCAEFGDYDGLVQDRAIAMATRAMRSLTGWRVGGCPITVRPCPTGCLVYGAVYGGWQPQNWNGTWSNCGCGGGCIHNPLALDPPVGEVTSVKIDGVELDTDEYRVVDGNKLIRSDGQPWPGIQNLGLPDTEVGTWSVTYYNGLAVDALGAYAAGIMACEFAKACSGAKCRLPSNVTEIVRQGITMTILPGTFPGGVTGIREVDAYVRTVNPSRFTVPPAVWVPSQKKPVTWR